MDEHEKIKRFKARLGKEIKINMVTNTWPLAPNYITRSLTYDFKSIALVHLWTKLLGKPNAGALTG